MLLSNQIQRAAGSARRIMEREQGKCSQVQEKEVFSQLRYQKKKRHAPCKTHSLHGRSLEELQNQSCSEWDLR